MQVCKIKCTTRANRGLFTVEESAWLDQFIPECTKLTKESGRGAGRARLDFYTRVEDEFLKAFPYRSPEEHSEWTFNAEQKALALSHHDRGQLRSHIRSKVSAWACGATSDDDEGTAERSKSRRATKPADYRGMDDSEDDAGDDAEDDDEGGDESNVTKSGRNREEEEELSVLAQQLEVLGDRYQVPEKWQKVFEHTTEFL
ncbi:hypothetical protein FRC08_018547 [Ceratobasidium sp. 394]|nr:hypothetical protein FRC08_018547 [Ceratobasidium sp. 394]